MAAVWNGTADPPLTVPVVVLDFDPGEVMSGVRPDPVAAR